jgi:hypothetical protein
MRLDLLSMSPRTRLSVAVVPPQRRCGTAVADTADTSLCEYANRRRATRQDLHDPCRKHLKASAGSINPLLSISTRLSTLLRFSPWCSRGHLAAVSPGHPLAPALFRSRERSLEHPLRSPSHSPLQHSLQRTDAEWRRGRSRERDEPERCGEDVRQALSGLCHSSNDGASRLPATSMSRGVQATGPGDHDPTVGLGPASIVEEVASRT